MPVKVEWICDCCGKKLNSTFDNLKGTLKVPRIHHSFIHSSTETVNILACGKECLSMRLQQILIEYKLLEPTKK